ncbi:MAG: transposase [Burkholderia sp.]
MALGKIRQALGYLGNQWPKLCRHIENEAWPICNQACEDSIRPFVLGSKNWLFSDRVAGAKASLNLYSLIETCKANHVDVYQYLIDLCSRRCRSHKRSTTTKRCRLRSLASSLANRRPDR